MAGMRKPLFALAVILLLAFSFSCLAQKRVAELKPKHAAALEQFLSANKSINFMSEKMIDEIEPNYLKEMSKEFGKKIVPYYQFGDFNNDRIEDFAMILLRDGETKENGATSEGHAFDYPLLIVIFNGQKDGKFRLAFKQEINAPLFCFLNKTGDKREPLYFAVFESDADTMSFAPAGKGYIAQSEGR